MGKIAKKEQALLEVSDVCINCDAPLDLDQRFCSNCGGKRMYNRITWRNLFEDFVDRFLNIENAFLKTFIALFIKPEDVIGGYMKGMRKKYLPAFSYFAVAVTVAGVSAFIFKNWFMDDLIQAQSSFYSGETAEIQKTFSSQWTKTMMDYQSVIYFTIIPLMALLSRVVFWNYKKYNLVEHFVIYLYGYSHIALITTILSLLTIWNQTAYQVFSILSTFIMIGYMTYILKRLFALDTGSIILKTAFFFLLFCSLFIGSLFVGGAFLGYKAVKGELSNDNFLFEMVNKSIEAKKKELEKKDSLHIDTIKTK